MLIQETILIQAPLETVWNVFTDIGNWPEWNSICRECRFEDGNVLEEGACISFELEPLIFPLRIAPVIETYEEEKSVTWSGSKWGIHARHTFNFDRVGDYTTLESLEAFSGVTLWPARLIGMHHRLHALTQRLLSAIKAEAESRAAHLKEEHPV
jgi:hypothetical protein